MRGKKSIIVGVNSWQSTIKCCTELIRNAKKVQLLHLYGLTCCTEWSVTSRYRVGHSTAIDHICSMDLLILFPFFFFHISDSCLSTVFSAFPRTHSDGKPQQQMLPVTRVPKGEQKHMREKPAWIRRQCRRHQENGSNLTILWCVFVIQDIKLVRTVCVCAVYVCSFGCCQWQQTAKYYEIWRHRNCHSSKIVRRSASIRAQRIGTNSKNDTRWQIMDMILQRVNKMRSQWDAWSKGTHTHTHKCVLLYVAEYIFFSFSFIWFIGGVNSTTFSV